jgi:hypothetical protein
MEEIDPEEPTPEAPESPLEEPVSAPEHRHPASTADPAKLPEGTTVDHPQVNTDRPKPSAKAKLKAPDTHAPSAKSPQKIPDVPKRSQPVHRSHITVQQTVPNTGNATVKTTQNTVKQTEHAVKASKEATQASIKAAQASSKAAQQAARVTAEASRRAAELLRETAKAAAEAAKVATKVIAAVAKATAVAIEEFIGFLASGGWVALVIIAVIIIILVIVVAVIGYLDLSITVPI